MNPNQQDSVAVLRELARRIRSDCAGIGDLEAQCLASLPALDSTIAALQSQQGASADRGEAFEYPSAETTECESVTAAVMLAERARFQDDEGCWWVPEATFNTMTSEVARLESLLYPMEAPPPLPAESAEGSLTYAEQRKVVEHMTTELRAAIPMLQSVLQRAEAIDCQPLAAAPSGVSDAERALDRLDAAVAKLPGRRMSWYGFTRDDRLFVVAAALEAALQPTEGSGPSVAGGERG